MSNPMSEQIARLIEQLLEENGGQLEFQRARLATDVGCVPSQINYVISSRFNQDRGYIVESRRGGGGYIKIRKISFDTKTAILMHMLSAIGESIDAMSARAMCVSLYDNGFLDELSFKLVLSAVSDRALQKILRGRDGVRADILKSVVLSLR